MLIISLESWLIDPKSLDKRYISIKLSRVVKNWPRYLVMMKVALILDNRVAMDARNSQGGTSSSQTEQIETIYKWLEREERDYPTSFWSRFISIHTAFFMDLQILLCIPNLFRVSFCDICHNSTFHLPVADSCSADSAYIVDTLYSTTVTLLSFCHREVQ